VAELRTRLAPAEEQLTELKAILEDMRRDRDAWREQAQARLLPAPPGTYVIVAVTAYDRMRSTIFTTTLGVIADRILNVSAGGINGRR
jgi:hypothetical protein